MYLRTFLTLAVLVTLFHQSLAATIHPGDILVADDGLDAIVLVDPTNGDRTIVSSNSVGTGTAFVVPEAIVVESLTSLLVVDRGVPGILRIDPATGNRSIVSSNSVGTGPTFGTAGAGPIQMIAETPTTVLVSDIGTKDVFRVDTYNGNRALFAIDFGNPQGLAIESSGDLLVIDSTNSALWRVDANGASRSILSDGTHGTGPAWSYNHPNAIAVQSGGGIIVADDSALYKVDPISGDRSILSNASNGTGPNFTYLGLGIDIDAAGNILLPDQQGDAIFSVDPASGNRTIISGGGVGTGPDFGIARSITVVPEPSTIVLGAFALVGLLMLGGRSCSLISKRG